jgi:hypothetical protein
MSREAAADTRSRKSGHGAADLVARWPSEAAEVGWTVDRLDDAIEQAARSRVSADVLTVSVGSVLASVHRTTPSTCVPTACS